MPPLISGRLNKIQHMHIFREIFNKLINYAQFTLYGPNQSPNRPRGTKFSPFLDFKTRSDSPVRNRMLCFVLANCKLIYSKDGGNFVPACMHVQRPFCVYSWPIPDIKAFLSHARLRSFKFILQCKKPRSEENFYHQTRRSPPPPLPEIWPQCNYTIEIIDIECVLNHESCLAPLFLKCAVINSPYLIWLGVRTTKTK